MISYVSDINLITDGKHWTHRKDDPISTKPVFIKIAYGEVELARKVKSGGGVWNKEKQLWKVPLQTVLDLNIEYRMVKQH